MQIEFKKFITLKILIIRDKQIQTITKTKKNMNIKAQIELKKHLYKTYLTLNQQLHIKFILPAT